VACTYTTRGSAEDTLCARRQRTWGERREHERDVHIRIEHRVNDVGARSSVDEQALSGQVVHVRQCGKRLVQDDSDNTPDKMSGLEAYQHGTDDGRRDGCRLTTRSGSIRFVVPGMACSGSLKDGGKVRLGRVSAYIARTRRISNPLEVLYIPVDPLKLIREAHLADRRRSRQANFPREPPNSMQKDHSCRVRNRSPERSSCLTFDPHDKRVNNGMAKGG
jgi:hypothetical protein